MKISFNIKIKNLIPLIFILGSLISLEDQAHIIIFQLSATLSIVLFFFQSLKNNFSNFITERKFSFFITSFILSSILSSLIVFSEVTLVRLLFLSTCLLTCFNSAYGSDINSLYKNILNSILIITPLIILLSLIYANFEINRFEGFMGNPNAFGRFCAFMIPVYFINIRESLQKKLVFQFSDYFNILIFFLLVFLSFFTNSRATYLLIFIFLASLFCYNFKFSNLLKFSLNSFFNKVLSLFIIFSLFIGVYFIGAYDGIIEKTRLLNIAKESEIFGTIDITNGRSALIDKGLATISSNFFGVDSNQKNLDEMNYYDAHNNYLNFAIKYGVINSFLFHSLFLYFLIYFYRSKNKDNLRLLGFILTAQLLIYWIVETAAVIYPVWLIISIYCISRQKDNKKNKKQNLI